MVVDGTSSLEEADAMPAVTAEPLTLPRLAPLAEPATDWRDVRRIVTAHRQLEGEGFVVRRPFPGMDLPLADPFLLLDHMGAFEYGPGEARAPRGIRTVASRPSRTCWTGRSNTRTPPAAVGC
jgi:hypothetical protein